MKRYLILLALFACTFTTNAQYYSSDWYSSPESEASMKLYYKQIFHCQGKVYGTDEFTPDPYPLQGANIVMTCLGDTTQTSGNSAWKDGDFWIGIWSKNRIKDTRVHVRITYLGMETFDTIMQVEKTKEDGVDSYNFVLDSICLHSIPVTLAEAEVVAELQRMYQHGDTIIFNAGAYEMPTGSVLLDLVRRLPGLKYEKGELTYLGESIEEIRLNGEHFFEHDMSIALNNMPSDKLKSLKVYEVPDDTLNVHSDNHYIMDMETNEPIAKTIFANVGAGTNEQFDKYQASLNLSAWVQNKGDISTYWNMSNIPEGGYSLEEKNQYGNLYYDHQFGKTTVGASASYNSYYNRNRSSNLSKTYMPDYTQSSVSESESASGSGNWNGNININRRVGKTSYVYVSGGINTSRSDGNSESNDSLTNEYQNADSVCAISSSRQSSKHDSNSKGYNFNMNFNTRFKEDSKYSLRVNTSINQSDGENVSETYNENHFYQKKKTNGEDSIMTIKHLVTSPSNNTSFNTNISLDREFGDEGNGWIGLGYNISYSGNDGESRYDDILDGCLQNVDSLHQANRQSSIRQGISLDFTISDSIYRFNVYSTVTPVNEKADKTISDKTEHLEQKGMTYNANANIQVKVFSLSRISLRYSCRNSLPGLNNQSTLTDYSDPMNISEGNRNLKNGFSHDISFEYMLKSWMTASIQYGTQRNAISSLTMIERETGARRTRPENINGNWNHSERLFFSYPFDDLSLTLNVNHSFQHRISYVQSFSDVTPSTSASDYRNFSCSLNAGYSNRNWLFQAESGYSKEKNKSDYITQSNGGQRINCRGSIEYTSDFGLGASTDISLDKPFGYELSSANEAECMWNMNAHYRFLKSKQAEFSLTWRDILNDFNGFDSYVSATGWGESRTYGYTSMFIIAFSYRFNSF